MDTELLSIDVLACSWVRVGKNSKRRPFIMARRARQARKMKVYWSGAKHNASNESKQLPTTMVSKLRTRPSHSNLKYWLLGIPLVVVSLQITSLLLDSPSSTSWTVSHQLQSRNTATFALARNESLGFFRDVPESEWQRLKMKVTYMYPNVKGNLTRMLKQETGIPAAVFYQTHYEPDFACRHERRLGAMGDGGKWVCDPHRLPDDGCLVYSVGSSGDASFEEALAKFAPQCEIHTFDMDASYANAVHRAGAQFHAWGIAQMTRQMNNNLYMTLADTMRELSHEGRTIDILKIDCEGCEWAVAPSFFDVDIRQVLIELHSVKTQRSSHMPMPQSIRFFHEMYKHGYVIFHKEVNIQYWHYLQCIEYGFLKLHTDFLNGTINTAS